LKKKIQKFPPQRGPAKMFPRGPAVALDGPALESYSLLCTVGLILYLNSHSLSLYRSDVGPLPSVRAYTTSYAWNKSIVHNKTLTNL